MVAAAMPPHVVALLERLWEHGHAAYAVGGGVRDALLGRPGHDIDLATDARPERILELFPDGQPRGQFGTVDIEGVEVTTFRRDHTYRDHRRPDQVTWTDDVVEDLRRRDFTINALAWGRPADPSGPGDPALLDPTGGIEDMDARLLRAVGEPGLRFEEDALRLLRGARFAATLGLAIEPLTLDAMRAHGAETRWLSAERIGGELRRMLLEARPSDGLRILESIGVLAVVLPEVSAQHGVPQAKIPGHDLFDHSMATADAAAALPDTSERLILAALLHDIGKPATAADGHFFGHAEVGARMASGVLQRLRWSRVVGRERVGAHPGAHVPVPPGLDRCGHPPFPATGRRRPHRRPAATAPGGQHRQRPGPRHGRAAGAPGAPRRATAADVPLTLADLCVTGDDLVAAVGRPAGSVGRRHAATAAGVGGQRPAPQSGGRAADRRPALAGGGAERWLTGPGRLPVAFGSMIELLLQADRLLTVDMVDQAQATYQRVADQDPNNAIAVVGLARCALARGEDRDAYALAARALLIDPENDMARRMEARMAEVLTYRGETLPAVAATPGRAAGRGGTRSWRHPASPPESVAAIRRVVRPAQAPGRSWLDRLRGH